MNGVSFGNYHSGQDFALVLNSKKIGVPQPKIYKIPIDSADGELDLTEFFGGVKYGNRELEFRFTKIYGNFIEVFSALQGAIHGRRMRIILDEDPSYYYFGRVYVDQWESNATTGIVTVKCDCDPYKLKLEKTVEEITIDPSGSMLVSLTNARKPSIPTITTSEEITIAYNGGSYSVSAGTYMITNLLLEEGVSEYTITGAEGTTVRIEYQEGAI